MTDTPAVWLIAKRELLTRLHSRFYQISTVVVAVGVVVAIALPSMLDLSGGPTRLGLIRVDRGTDDVIRLSGRSVGMTIETTRFDDEADMRAALADRSIDAALIGGTRLLYRRDEDPRLTDVVSDGLSRRRRTEIVDGMDVTVEQRKVLLGPATLPASSLEPPDPDAGARTAITTIVLVLLFLAITTYGSTVLSSVIEEKSNRVIEVTLSRVRAHIVLAGKILGVSVLGVVQLGVIAIVGVLTLLIVKDPGVPVVDPATIGSLALWFGLGFALYNTLFATLGSLASRQEDAQAAVMPLWLILGAVYAYGFFAAQSPDALTTRVLSYVPLSAPFIMPMRSLGGDVTWWQITMAAILTVVTAAGLLRVGGRVFSGSALRFGGRIKVREAWQARA